MRVRRIVVVDNEVDVEVGRHSIFDLTQETQEFLVSVPGFAARDDLTGQDIERSEQRGRPVALVIVGHAFDLAKAHWQ